MKELISDIKLYLTSLESNLSQTIYSQSIGGYISNSLVYPDTTLVNTIGLYETNLQLNTPVSGNWSDWDDVNYLSIGGEIIKVEEVTGNSVIATQRGVNNIVNMHLATDEIRGISSGGLFDNVLNDEYKQYRCIAVKNTSSNIIGQNTYVYIRQNSRNPKTTIELAIEIPKSPYLSGTSDSWDNIKLVDADLIGSYSDNQFKDAYMRLTSGPNSGQNRTINSFDASTGTFIFYDPLPINYSNIYSSSISYTIDPSPAQRVKTGTESPIVNTTYVTDFLKTEKNYPTSINLLNNGTHGDFRPNDVFYIWLKRTLTKNSDLFNDNSVIITINYATANVSA